ncbi:MAG: GIY-YIG nuclease family protein [Clostridia bacterium]|nr:GIY-YIG nuclease family protein [Clostridia bacterium]
MKVVEIILKDNSAKGPQKFSIQSETTVGYKISRTEIDNYLSDSFYDNLKTPGVYILVGTRVNDGKRSVYIGQSDNVAKRLYEHKGGQDGEKKQGKLFWSECLAFVATNSQMHKGHAEYLELEFYKRAYEANQYLLENENIPSEKFVSESDKIFCDDFIEDCKLLTSLMGVPVFDLSNKEEKEIFSSSERMKIFNGNKRGIEDPKYVNANGYFCQTVDNEKAFIILENSIVARELTKKASPTIKRLRRELQKRGYIKEENGKLVVKKEYQFASAGIAASFVLGRNASSKEWK